MSTTTKVKYREASTQELNIRVDDHETDLSGETVFAYAYHKYTERPQIELGKTVGTSSGLEFVIALDPSILEPGTYDVEIISNDKTIYPLEQDENLTIIVLNSKHID